MRSKVSCARRDRRLAFESLENRWVLSASIGSIDQIMSPNLTVASPLAAAAAQAAMTPALARAAYNFNGITFGGVAGDGANQTIAIVDAFNDPNIVSDLAFFDQTYSLPAPPSFTIVNQSGGTNLPGNNKGWASEIALDVEWAHAIAPGANILLVEANSALTSALNSAEDFARNASGVVVVSNSWGGSEFSTEKSMDFHYTTPAGHAGVTFTVAAGDSGAKAEYPSSSPDVLSVGGSTLKLKANGTRGNETVWNGGGGGASRFEATPSYQTGLGIAKRGTPDVSYDANPNTGFAVFDSFGVGGWGQFGGTSAGAPQWAALIAIADQGRTLAGKAPLANAQSVLYSLPLSDFHDITTGGSKGIQAAAGYDLVSGLGSPIANLLIRDLVAFNGSTALSVVTAGSAIAPNTIAATRLGVAVGESDAWTGAPEIWLSDRSSSVNFAATRLQPMATNGATQFLAARGSLAVAIESEPMHHGRHAITAEATSWSAADSSLAASDAFFAGLVNAAA
jgi:subtilase family serine protease